MGSRLCDEASHNPFAGGGSRLQVVKTASVKCGKTRCARTWHHPRLPQPPRAQGTPSAVGAERFANEDGFAATQAHGGRLKGCRWPRQAGRLAVTWGHLRTPHLLAEASLLRHPHQVAAQPLLCCLQGPVTGRVQTQCVLTPNGFPRPAPQTELTLRVPSAAT